MRCLVSLDPDDDAELRCESKKSPCEADCCWPRDGRALLEIIEVMRALRRGCSLLAVLEQRRDRIDALSCGSDGLCAHVRSRSALMGTTPWSRGP